MADQISETRKASDALYKSLQENGYQGLPSEDVFYDTLQDSTQASAIYQSLEDNGYQGLPDRDTFYNTLIEGYGKEPETAIPTVSPEAAQVAPASQQPKDLDPALLNQAAKAGALTMQDQIWRANTVNIPGENPYNGKTYGEVYDSIISDYGKNLAHPDIDPYAEARAQIMQSGIADDLKPEDADRLALNIREGYANKYAGNGANQMIASLPDRVPNIDQLMDGLWYTRDMQGKIAHEARRLGLRTENYVNYYVKPHIAKALSDRYGYDVESAKHIAARLLSQEGHTMERVRQNEATAMIGQYAAPRIQEYFDQAVAKADQQFRSEGEGSMMTPYGNAGQMLGASIRHYQNTDPAKIWEQMQPDIQQMGTSIMGDPTFIAEAQQHADEEGVDLSQWMEGRILPMLESQIQSQFEQMAIEREMPKNTMDYLWANIRSSLIGTLANAALASQARRRMQTEAMQRTEMGQGDYKPGFFAKVGGGAAAMLSDMALPFGGPFGLTAKFATKPVQGMAQTLITDGMRPLFARMAQSAASGSLSLGAFEGLKGGVEGAFNPEGGYESLLDETDRSAGEILTDIVKGAFEKGVPSAVTGASMVGGPVGQKLSNGRGVLANILGWGTQVGVDAAGATALGTIPNIIKGDVNLEDVGKEFASNVGTFAALGLHSKAKEFASLADGGRAWNGIPFSKSEVQMLEERYLSPLRKQISEIESAQKRRGLIEQKALGIDAEEAQREAVKSAGAMMYNDLMRSYAVPRELKVKVAQALGMDIPEHALKPDVLELAKDAEDKAIELGWVDAMNYDYNKPGGVAEKVMNGEPLSNYDLTLRLIFQDNAAYNEALKKQQSGEPLTEQEQELVDINNSRIVQMRREYEKQERGRIIEEFERLHNMEPGSLSRMLGKVAEGKAVDSNLVNEFEDMLRDYNGKLDEAKAAQDAEAARLAEAAAAETPAEEIPINEAPVEEAPKVHRVEIAEGETPVNNPDGTINPSAPPVNATTGTVMEVQTIDGRKAYIVEGDPTNDSLLSFVDEQGNPIKITDQGGYTIDRFPASFIQPDEKGAPIINETKPEAPKEEITPVEPSREEKKQEPETVETTPAMSRIKVNEKGEPLWEESAAEDTAAALRETLGSDEEVTEEVDTEIGNLTDELNELTKPEKGKNKKRTNLNDRLKKKEEIRKVRNRLDYWNSVKQILENGRETEAGQQVDSQHPDGADMADRTAGQEEVRPQGAEEKTGGNTPESRVEGTTADNGEPPVSDNNVAGGTPPVEQAPKPTAEQKIAQGTVKNNIGKRFEFNNQDGTRSEVTIDSFKGDDKVEVTRQDYDANGQPKGEPYKQDLNLMDVGNTIVNGTLKPVLSTEEQLRKAYKGMKGIQNLLDVMSEEEMEQFMAAHKNGDKEALETIKADLYDAHKEDLILNERDKRNSNVNRIMDGTASREEKLRRVRKEYQHFDDAAVALSDEAMQPTTLEEYVADLHSRQPKSGEGPIAYFSYDEGGKKVVGLQDETGHGTKSGGDTKGYAPWLAPKGKGMSLKQYAENIHSQLPEAIQEQYSDQDVRNAILELFGGAERPSDITTMVIRRGIIQAEQAARRMEDMWIEGGPDLHRVSPDDNTFAGRLARAKEQTNTEPSEAQKEKGNYKKGHISFGGYDFVMENPEGTFRRGTDKSGKSWEQKMNNTYGYILGKRGKDGDHLDMFINDAQDLDNWDGKVYVVDQVDPETGKFDEHKIMYGFDSEAEARDAYLSNYEEGWKGLGRITGVDKETFDKWLDSSERKIKEFSEHSIPKEALGKAEAREATKAEIDKALMTELGNELKNSGVPYSDNVEEGQPIIDNYNNQADKQKVEQGQPTFFKTPDGHAYGFTYKGKIYVDPRIATAETPIHEYGHLWAEMKRQTAKEEWDHIKDVLLRDKLIEPFIEKVRREYPELTNEGKEDDFVEEVLTQFSGKHGAEKLHKMAEEIKAELGNDAAAETIAQAAIRKVKSILNEFWKGVADMMGWKYTTAEDIADAVLRDMLNGVNPVEKMREAPKDLKSQQEIERTLMGVHNISEEKLRKALKQGGLANPSMAVIDTKNHMHTDYGEISLIPKSSLIDSRTGRNAGTFTADAWTPSYPQVVRRMTDKGQSKFWKDLRKLNETSGDLGSQMRMAFDTWLDKEVGQERLAYWYLTEKGLNPEIVMNKNPYDKKVADRLEELTDNGNKMVSSLPEDQIKEIADMYHAYKESIGEPVTPAEERIKKIKERMDPNKPSPFLKLQQWRIEELQKYGELLHSLSDFDNRARMAAHEEGKPDVYETMRKAQEAVKSQDLQADFEKWLDQKAKDYGVEEWLFNGTDYQGRQKWVRNTLDNASRLMKKEGLNGAVGWSNIGSWIATVANKEKTLAGIRRNKKNLNTSEEQHDAWREQWAERLYSLVDRIGNGDPFSGDRILKDILEHNDFAGYYKREYGKELTKEEKDLIDTFIKEVRTNFPTGYFETKFERPVGLEEFEVAVIPETTSPDIVEALKNAGLDVRTYDASDHEAKDENRRKAAMDAVQGRDDIMFQMMGTKGAAEADKTELFPERMDNLRIAEESEKAGVDAKAIKLATGWERGADGKWRYEIPDADVNVLEKYQKKSEEMKKRGVSRPMPIFRLEDLLGKDNEVFNYYPEMRRMSVLFSNILPDGTAGLFDGKNIEINSKETSRFEGDDLNNENVYGTLLHEVQHAIQDIEGFARGGNLQTSTTGEGIKAIVSKKRAEEDRLYKKIEANYNILDNPEELKAAAELDGRTVEDERQNIQDMIDDLSKQAAQIGAQIEKIEKTKSPARTDAIDLYNRLAGEVEARNVTNRMALNDIGKRQTLASATEDVPREDQVIINNEGGESASFTNSKEEFDKVRERAIKENGTVMPGLADKQVTIVPVKNHPFKGSFSDVVKQAHKWAKENLIRKVDDGDPFKMKDGTPFEITGGSIDEFLFKKEVNRSANKGLHIATMMKLPEIIRESVDAEIHPDYLHNEEGKRDNQSEVNKNTLVHRFYGAIKADDGNVYRVALQIHEDRDSKNRLKTYRVNNIELDDAPRKPTASSENPSGANDTTNSISGANLLNKVEKSKDPGKKLLDESKKTQESEKKAPKFQKVGDDTHSNNFKNFFGDWEKEPEKASKIVDQEGKPMVLYHQTDNDFTVFEPRHEGAGTSDFETPFGIFMKPTSKDIGVRGNKQMPLYANIRNPFEVENRRVLSEALKKNVPGYKELLDEYNRIDQEYSERFKEAEKFDHDKNVENWNKKQRGEITEEEYENSYSFTEEKVLDEWREAIKKPMSDMKELLDKWFRDSEYDGVIIRNDEGSFGRKTETIIALEPNQVKSATENVGTYDKGNPDIRFQRVGNPEPELTEEERQYWKKWDADMKKWKEQNAIPEDAQEPGEETPKQPDESMMDYVLRTARNRMEKAKWQTAPKLDDYLRQRSDKDALEAAKEELKKYPESQIAKMRVAAAEFRQIRSAMGRQKAYDKATVKAVTDFAQDYMKLGFGDNLSRGEIERMLSSVKNATGAKDIRKEVDNIMNILTDNYLRNLDQQVQKLSSVKELKQTAQGVEAQGKLELKGQRMIQAFREARQNRMTADEIRERMAEVSEHMARNDEEAPMWQQEYEGLSIALQYMEDIEGSRSEWGALDREYKDAVNGYRESGRSYKAQQEYLEELDKAMMENKLERIGMFGEIIGRLQGNIAESMQGAKEFVEREKQRIANIQRLANYDLAGKDMGAMREKQKGKPANFFLQPLATFEQMLKQFGSRNANGEGYLYDHFMRSWMDSIDKSFTNEQKAKEELDEKAREVFGDDVKRWSDLYKLTRNEKEFPGMDVKIIDQNEPKEFHLNQGNLLYIYMANKMTDGAMKLRKMGITEEDVNAIKEHLDPRLVDMADWLQDDYLVRKRTEYNKVHERMFGAPMAAIDHYFPIRILGDARVQEQDVNVPDAETLPSTITGNIIKRRRNSLPLDILHTDALSLAIEHVEDMERWAATAEWNKDVNTLLSYTTFRNKVKNMKTIYGSGDALWNTFKDAAKMAAGTYNPSAKSGHVDKTISNIAKGVTAAKISFRAYTAFKQTLSAPAFLHDVDLGKFIKYSVNPYGSWKWAMENMPVFEKRWKSRQAGDTRLMDDPTDWKMWKTNIVKLAAQLGMSPNALVDGITCAVGARSIYESRVKKYKDMGMDEEKAEKRALQDAEIGYNLTQQSSEGAFVSAIQKDRTVAANMLSVFRNSSMAYTRQWVDAARNLKHRMQPGYREDSVNFMARQFEEQLGLDKERALEAAEKEYARAGRHDVARMLNMMFGVTVAWNLGASLPYLLIGDDDETKKEMMTDALIRGLMAGPTEGFAAGNIISELVARSAASAETRKTFKEDGLGAAVDAGFEQAGDYEVNPLPFFADIQGMIKKMGYDKYAAAQDLFNICMQSAVGVNPQTFTDIWNACMDYGNPSWMPFTDSSVGNDDLANAKEIALFIMRLTNAPTSSWRNKYIDELGMGIDEAKNLSYEEMARRYANYKHWKDAPIMGWFRGDDARQKKMESIRKQFDKAVQERIGRLTDDGLQKTFDNTEDLTERKMLGKEAAKRADSEDKMATTDSEKEDVKMGVKAYARHRKWQDLVDDLELAKAYRNLKADYKTRREEASYKSAIDEMEFDSDPKNKKIKEIESEIQKRIDWIRDGKYDTESGRRGNPKKKENEPKLLYGGQKQLAGIDGKDAEDIMNNIRNWRNEAFEMIRESQAGK